LFVSSFPTFASLFPTFVSPFPTFVSPFPSSLRAERSKVKKNLPFGRSAEFYIITYILLQTSFAAAFCMFHFNHDARKNNRWAADAQKNTSLFCFFHGNVPATLLTFLT
jgi:hypothetical protein